MIALALAETRGAARWPLWCSPAETTLRPAVNGEVHTDSRKVVPGSIFFAMPGEVTDGHLFAPAAVEAGAALVIAERQLELPVSQVVVANGVIGARRSRPRGRGAGARRSGGMRVVAVTGSNGKTDDEEPAARDPASRRARRSRPGARSTTTSAPRSPCSAIDESTRSSSWSRWARARSARSRASISIVVPDIAIVLKVGLAHVGEFGGTGRASSSRSPRWSPSCRQPPWRCSTPTTRGVANMAGRTAAARSLVRASRRPRACGPSDIEATASRHRVHPRIADGAAAARAAADPRRAPRDERARGDHRDGRELGVPARAVRAGAREAWRAPSAGAWRCSTRATASP